MKNNNHYLVYVTLTYLCLNTTLLAITNHYEAINDPRPPISGPAALLVECCARIAQDTNYPLVHRIAHSLVAAVGANYNAGSVGDMIAKGQGRNIPNSYHGQPLITATPIQ